MERKNFRSNKFFGSFAFLIYLAKDSPAQPAPIIFIFNFFEVVRLMRVNSHYIVEGICGEYFHE